MRRLVGVAGLLILLMACTPDAGPPVDIFREGAIRDIAAFLPTTAPTEELTKVQELLTEPHPSGTGVALIPGIMSVDADYGTMVLYIAMLPDTSQQRKEEVAAMLRADARVERVEYDAKVDFSRDS